MDKIYHSESNRYLAPFLVANVNDCAITNRNYRKEFWTGCYLQMTLMSIPVCSDVGVEIHKDMDQMIRIEQGKALVKSGKTKQCLDYTKCAGKNDVIFVPAGTWHNIINTGNVALKLSSVYAPPHHPVGTVQASKEDSEGYTNHQ
ncbi:MAG: cupin domain-containing protein [Lachnospiraceae bacterium]|nr:cupin domain-containing protein [Lachnospiraceae bacterium]